MELREHLYYQSLWGSECPIEDACQSIEKLLLRIGITTRNELETLTAAHLDQPDDGEGILSQDEVYRAVVLNAFFSRCSEAQIHDGINLARKESMARRLSRLLHEEETSLARIEAALQRFSLLPVGDSQVSPSLAAGIRVELIRTLISENLFYIGVAKNHITMRDVSRLLGKFIGKHGRKSRIGGKSSGMVLANAILAPAFGEPTGLEEHLAFVESYYLTAELFTRFIEHNRLEEGHGLKYMDESEREDAEKELDYRFARGRYPEDIEARLKEVLQQLGEGPLIVRSSSLLEDSMGFPFYGKYESVFVSNAGTPEERFTELMGAIRTVYRSILASSVIEYRKDKALLDYEDMMCLLVQRVVGARHGSYYFPEASGVAFSRNDYCWSRRIDPQDGIARIVYGLGTRAVDRGGTDYPRLISLGAPDLRPEGTDAERMKYSQRDVDVLNLDECRFESVHFVDLYNSITNIDPGYDPTGAMSVVSERRAVGTGGSVGKNLGYGEAVLDFAGIIGDQRLPSLLKSVLARLEQAYGAPVDIEFAWQDGKLYILQCRPLTAAGAAGATVEIPTPGPSDTLLFETRRDVFRSAIVENTEVVVMVDGVAYQELPSDALKLEVARTIGRINKGLKGRRFMLIGPGRWGSSNLELGVRVSYGEINNATVLAEVGSSRRGYTPEVSYGTHFFQDLIEADIVPLALFPDETGSAFDEKLIAESPDSLSRYLGDQPIDPSVAAAVRVVDLTESLGKRLSIYLSSSEQHGVGILNAV